MDILLASAKAVKELFKKEYLLTVAKSGKSNTFKIVFGNEDFKHLSGIHKLTDLEYSNYKSDVLFNYALSGKIKETDLKESIHFNEIAERLENLKNLEQYLDSNMGVFKWDNRKSEFSSIVADHMLKENTPNENKAYVFLKEKSNIFKTSKKLKVDEIKSEVAISFFLEKNNDYAKNQMAYTLLKNVKIDKSTGKHTVLYDFDEVKKAKLAEKSKPSATPEKTTTEKQEEFIKASVPIQKSPPKQNLNDMIAKVKAEETQKQKNPDIKPSKKDIDER